MQTCLIAIIFAGCAVALSAPATAKDATFSIAATNVTDVLSNVSGGIAPGTRALDKFDVTGTFDGGDEGWSGISAFADLQWTDSNTFNGDLVGALQDVSNIDAPADVRVLNAWIAKDLSDQIGVKAGIIDLNSEFDVQPTGALFLNSSHGIGGEFSQAGLNGPSIFPSTGLGAILTLHNGDDWQIKAAAFEGVPGNPAHPGRTELTLSNKKGALLVAEAQVQATPRLMLGVGAWTYTSAFAPIGAPPGTMERGNHGLYAIADGLLYAAPGGGGLNGWIRAGVANGKLNLIDTSLGGGLVYTGIGARSDDQIGLAVAYAHIGSPARRAAQIASAPLDDAETVIETTYNLVFNDYVFVQPDLQYVIRPGADPSIPNALVVGARITLAWP